MVMLTLVAGKKGPGDILVLLTAYGEPLTFEEWLFIGKCMLDSESSYYPLSQGNRGPCLLLEALLEISFGVNFEQVIARYGLDRKNRKLNVEDKRNAKHALQASYVHDFV